MDIWSPDSGHNWNITVRNWILIWEYQNYSQGSNDEVNFGTDTTKVYFRPMAFRACRKRSHKSFFSKSWRGTSKYEKSGPSPKIFLCNNSSWQEFKSAPRRVQASCFILFRVSCIQSKRQQLNWIVCLIFCNPKLLNAPTNPPIQFKDCKWDNSSLMPSGCDLILHSICCLN